MNNNTIRAGYTRVTEILNPFNDFSKVPASVLENAQKRGTIVHDFCELYALNILIEDVPEEIKGYFESFKNWFDAYVLKVINCEERLYDDQYMITGKYDLLCILKDSPHQMILIDYKTPKIDSKSWQIQTAAYAYMLYQTHSYPMVNRACLQLSKQGCEPNFIQYCNYKKDIDLFFDHLTLHRFYFS